MDHPAGRGFDLDDGVAQWRIRQERASSLSPRELDELEDHMRALAALELELNPALDPATALVIARGQIGDTGALSGEFVRAGSPRWRRLFVIGWAMFAVSYLLPAIEGLGYETFLVTLAPIPYAPHLTLYMLPNLVMLMTIPVFRGRGPWLGGGVKWFLGLASIGALGAGIGALAIGIPAGGISWALERLAELRIGFWVWGASLACVALALRLRDREWASARVRNEALAPGQGAFE